MILHCFTQNFGWESRIKCLFDFIAHIYQTKNDLFVTKKCAKGAHYKLFLTEIIWVGHVRHVVRCKHYATYYTWDTQTLVTLIKSRVWLLRSVANQHLPREHCINITRPKYIKVSSFINPIFCSGHFPREPEHPPYIRNLSLYWFYNSQKPSFFQWHWWLSSAR